MIKLVICLIFFYLIYYIITTNIPRLVIKTKTHKIKNTIRSCFITSETDDYIFIHNNNVTKYIFLFPGLASHSISLHKHCKLVYVNLGQSYNIFGFKYNTYYNCIDTLSSHLARVIVHALNSDKESIDMRQFSKQLSQYTMHVLGYSYGCSVAIDTFLKLQDKYAFPCLQSFTSYKSFNTFTRAIKYQDSMIIRIFARLCTYIYANNFSYDNTNIMYLKTKHRTIVNHISDELIHKNAQFSYKFCKLNRINLVYDTYTPSECDTYFDYFFKSHIYFNDTLIAKIIKECD